MNPFNVLSIDKTASSKAVIQSAAFAMRDRKYSAKEIAQAQKMLLDPVSRACQEFLWFVDLGDIKERLYRKIAQKNETAHAIDMGDGSLLEWLPLFEKDHDR